MKQLKPHVHVDTTIGDLVTVTYEAAMKAYGNEQLARRIVAQLLLRKLRQQEHFTRHNI